MEAWLTALEASALARALRNSVWIYPLVNAGHVLGIALLVGGSVALDLRLLGAWRAVPVAPLWRVLTRIAASGFALAVGFGALLFAARATQYAESSFFLAKMLVVALTAIGSLVLQLSAKTVLAHDAAAGGALPARVRLAAAVSMGGWLAVLLLGRLVGYF
jgi:hypothetical protein